jgi:hypothetical protein
LNFKLEANRGLKFIRRKLFAQLRIQVWSFWKYL